MTTTQIAEHTSLVYQPSFWDPAKAYGNYQPDITAAVLEGHSYARKHQLEPAHKLIERSEGASMAYLTDPQSDFRPNGRLPVLGAPGQFNSADDVVLRTCVRLINGFLTGHFAGITISQDGHPFVHCSFGSYFRSIKDDGPFDLGSRKAAVLVLEDEKKCLFQATCFNPTDGAPIDAGLVQPIYNPRSTVSCYEHMKATDQLPMWAFAEHCVLGTDGVQFHPLMVETLAFITGLRSFVIEVVFKGHIIDRDWFGGLCDIWGYSEDPKVKPNLDHPQAGFQKKVVDGFKRFRTVEFLSQIAQDFCGYWTQRQALNYFDDTEFADKMRYMDDGNAPIVPNAPHVQTLYDKAKKAGVKFINHDTPFAQSL